MTSTDRLLPLCDLLLGAAHADGRLDQRERDAVRDLLTELCDGAVPPEIEACIAGFDPARFDLRAAAAPFRGDSIDDRKRVLYLVDAVNDADEELDLAEDTFLRALASALDLPATALAGLTVEVEVEVDLKGALAKVRKGPPPIPGASVDVDLS
ncbi:MAG: TerB family tellurite resistance protein [Myxococcales bacterium]|nr:TerB family tellurite resistance protein [Myxococcales bacterium]